MQILCITSLIYRTTNNLQNWQRYIDSKWAFSEIQIGKRRGDTERIYYFVLFRNQQKVFDAKMTKGAMKVVDWIAATLIEIETAAEEQFRISSSGAYIERIKIRCIKVPKTAHFIESIKAGLIEHAANLEKHMQNVTLNATTNINEFLKDCEAVIKKVGIPKIENEGGEKARRNRYSEINCAIKDLCDENSGSPDNVKSGSKHDTYIEKSVMTIIPRKRALPSGRNYDVRTEFQTARNVYSSCKELKFYKVNLPSVNPRWFDSQSLRVLDFNRISVFQTPNAWSIFINNIVRLPNLYRLNFINCCLETIPDDLFVKLPPTLFTLNLEGNNLQEISAQIKKLKNLMYLDVSNNPKLKSQGIPWEFFPRSLEDIQFYGTSIRATPQSVRESIKLHILKDDVFGREDIDFEDEFGFEDYAEVDLNAENLDLSHLHMKKFNDAKLKQNIKTLDLGHTGLEIFTFSRNFEFLTDLLLNNNQLKTIPWESLPTNLNTIDFSNNYLSEIGSIKHLINLSWFDLSNNNIDTIKDSEFNQLTQFIDINLNNNSLSMLPKNFEKIQSTILTLNLRHNKFSYKEQNLCVDLWDHLPEVRTLYLCQNRLGILPCDLSLQLENIAEIIATDCDIHYICPRLYSNITKLNVLKNPISALSFIPRFFLPVPQPKEEVEIPFTDEIDEKILLIDLSVVNSNIADYKKWDEWQKNMFQKVDDDERETELQCNCCASCGRQDTTKFEQKMVMDALLILAEEVEKDGSICHYKNKGYFARPSGTWAANVQTKLCDTCMVEFKDDRKVAAPPALKTISTLDLNLSDSESVDEEERDLSSCPLCYPSKTILPLPPLQSSIRQQQRFYREIKIPYNPPSKSWLRKTCKRLKLPLCCYVFKNAISSNNITHCEPTLTASVWGDGHSGYQSLSYLITGRLFNYHLFRILISDTILQNSDKNFENLDGFKNAKRKTEMKKNADYFVNSVEEWMSEIDLAAAAYLLQCNIALWERNGYWSLYNSLTFEKGFSIQHDAIVDQPTILLNNSFCEHNFFNPVINVGQRAERIEDRDVVMEEQQNLDIAEDMDIVENTNDVAELTKNMRELSLLFTEHPGNTDTLDLSSLSIDEFDDMDIPLEIKTLNVSRNKIKSMRFEKHFEFLRRLNLDKNQITNISWQTLPALLEYISLDNNYLTTIESIPLKFLKQLNINNNDLLKISWKMLPSSLEDIFFNGNHLTSIETVQHLKNLRRFSVTRNKITKITSDFNQLKNLVEIDLNYNCLISLPKGFELIHTSAEDGLTLCLAGNKFDYDKQNLNEDLWTKLPMIKTLNIWENKIDSLPCQLADRLEANSTIVASDCDIRHVCPKIYSKFKKLNLYNNELDALTFIPKTILQPPISQRKITVEYSSDLKVLDMHASIAKPPASFPKLFKKPEYTFNTITKKKNILNQVQCKCCAECNSSSRDTLMVQQMMVMDFNLRVNSKYEEVGDDYDTRETIYSSGGWVSKIRTRLCDPCKSEILLKVEESYQSFINDENAEIVKPKQSRIEKNFEASLQAPHEPMVATAELTTENTSLLPQLQQPSTSHYLPSIKTLYSHKNGFEDDHFAVYQDPVCDMTNTENAGYINDLPQKIILLNEGGIQVAEFDHSNDPSMLQQDAIRADQSKNQPLNDMQLDSTIHETNKEMDITDEYIVDLVLDMMEDHKVADNQNLDLNECEIVFENLQPKTISEGNKNDERVEEDGRQFYEYPIEGFNNNVILQARHYNFIMPEIYDLQISIPPMIEDLQRYLNLLELPSQLAANSPLLNFASVTTAGKNMITVSTLADGNCGYRAISILLTGVEDYFWKIRIKIYDHIVVNGHRIWGIGSQEQKIKFYKKLERILKMKKPTAVDLEFWCKNEDLYALADLFECNVYTYSPNPLPNYPHITGHYKNGEKIPHSPTLFLMWINNNHFEPILGFV